LFHASDLTVGTEMFMDEAVLNTGGVRGANTSSHMVLFGVTIGVGILEGIRIDNSFSGCTGVDVTAGVVVTTDVSVPADVGTTVGIVVTTDVGILDRIGIDNSFSSCTGVNVTEVLAS
jgi:hypothetical protein